MDIKLEGKTAAERIAQALELMTPIGRFSSWAGPRGAGSIALTKDDLKQVLNERFLAIDTLAGVITAEYGNVPKDDEPAWIKRARQMLVLLEGTK